MKGLTPIKAIRAKCLECSAGQPKEVRECVIPECALYSFRLGKNPNRQGLKNLGCFTQKSTAQLSESYANV